MTSQILHLIKKKNTSNDFGMLRRNKAQTPGLEPCTRSLQSLSSSRLKRVPYTVTKKPTLA